MDHRVKPGDDHLMGKRISASSFDQLYFGCSFSAAELMQ
jgi:hypothetical protein